MGNDAASSAQSKRMGDEEDGGDGKTVRSRGFWGKLSRWDRFRGCPEASGEVFRRFRAMGCGSDSGRAEGSRAIAEHVVDDVAGCVDV